MIRPALHCAALLLSLWLLGAAGPSAAARPDVPAVPDGAFDCGAAAHQLGHPGAKVEQCRELLPTFFRVVLSGGEFPAGHKEVLTFVWEDGRRLAATGYPVLKAYLQRHGIGGRSDVDEASFGELLDALRATPPGFSGGDLRGAVGDAVGGLSLKPLVATLVRADYRAFGPADPSGPPAPPGRAGSPPHGVPMPGGLVGRATLSVDAEYRCVWQVHTRVAPGQPWVTVSTERF
ncbi:MAG: hypothetical protein R3F39_12330 [Myxococcota bacterium]